MIRTAYTGNGRPQIRIALEEGNGGWNTATYIADTPHGPYSTKGVSDVVAILTDYSVKPDLSFADDVSANAKICFRGAIRNM